MHYFGDVDFHWNFFHNIKLIQVLTRFSQLFSKIRLSGVFTKASPHGCANLGLMAMNA